MWQKVAKFKGAEYFCKALYVMHSRQVRLEAEWDTLRLTDLTEEFKEVHVGVEPVLYGL